MKMNAYQELKKILEEINKSEKDIKDIYIFFKGHVIGFIEINNSNELKKLEKINYDNGYGTQYLKGYILFNDLTWLERREYDGKEWWEYKDPKIIKELIEKKKIDIYDYF